MNRLKGILCSCLVALSYLFITSTLWGSDLNNPSSASTQLHCCEICEKDPCFIPQIGMDCNGNAVAVWQNNTCCGSVIQANVWLGTWCHPQKLSTNCHAICPKVAVATKGKDIAAVAVWIQRENGKNILYAAMLPSSCEKWTNAAKISKDCECVIAPHYHVRMNEMGNAIVIWSSVDLLGNHYIHTSTSHIGFANAWSYPVYLSGP